MNIFSQFLRNGVLTSLSLALYFVAFAPRVRAEEPERPMKVYADGLKTVKDGATLHHAEMSGAAYRGHTVKNVDFSWARMREAALYDMTFINCNFSNADMQGLYCGENTRFIDCNFTDAKITGAVNLTLTPDSFRQTYDFQRKKLEYTTILLIANPDYQLDLSGFTIYKSDVLRYPQWRLELKLTDARLFDTTCAYSELLDSRSFKERSLYGISIHSEDYSNVDFSNFVIFNCCFDAPIPKNPIDSHPIDSPRFVAPKFDGANFSNAVVINCRFHGNISFEQLKSTWNYQNGRYDWGAVPVDLQRQIDDALKREGREPIKPSDPYYQIRNRPFSRLANSFEPKDYTPLYHNSPEEIEQLMKARKEALLADTEAWIARLEAKAASEPAPETK